MPPGVVRKLIGPEKILGLSVSDAAELASADIAPIDYFGIGPVFPTVTKKDAAPATGLKEFAALAGRASLPVVAIGGITVERARELRTAVPGVGIAVVSAICGAENPMEAARAFCE